MHCPECNSELNKDLTCTNCSYDLNTRDTFEAKSIDNKNLFNVLFLTILSIFTFLIFIICARKIYLIGDNILSIKSVGGQTLEEAYYFELGNLYQVLSILIGSVGIFISSMLLWLGLTKYLK